MERSNVRGLLAEDPATWARQNGALVVDFGATRGARMTPRAWLETVAAIDGRPHRESVALVDAVLRRAGLSSLANGAIGVLPAFGRAALAVAEVAVAVTGRAQEVLVPEPPLPWPHRHELRRLALELLAGTPVVLHTRDPMELTSLVARDAVIDVAVGAAHPAGPSVLVRVYGWGEPYEAFKRGLDERGVTITGGPIAHVLTGPDGFGPREALAIAYEAGLDVLEVREASSVGQTGGA